jgi:uroporphyrinogen decarboxylase
MTNRERMKATLEHRQPDTIPYQMGFTQLMRAKMIERYGEDFAAPLRHCMAAVPYRQAGARRPVGPDLFEDEFGVRWDCSRDKDIGVVCNRLVTPANVETHPLPDPHDPARYAKVADAVAAKGDRFLIAGIGFSLFERAWTLAGMETVMDAMLSDPPFVHRLLDRILEYNLAVIDRLCAYDIDAMQFGDDWGSQTGVLMGAPLWREYIKPRIRQMYGRVRAAGKFVFIHSCGRVQELFPDLIEIGLNVFNPFQPEVMDVYEMKRRYGRDLTFHGGISTQRLLPYGTVQEVRDEVRRMLDEVGRDGGYICAPAHGIPSDAKPENVMAMIEVLAGQ